MPVYKPSRHGVSLSEALHEAAAIAPIHRAMLSTFELWHPVGTPDGPIYTVNDFQPLVATIEAGAARNASVAISFLPCPVDITRPEESDTQGTPEIGIAVKQVSGVMSEALRWARGSLIPWQLTERVYASDDTTAPAILPPLSVFLSSVDVDGETVTLKASFGDSVNVSIPRLTFRRTAYPGLVQ